MTSAHGGMRRGKNNKRRQAGEITESLAKQTRRNAGFCFLTHIQNSSERTNAAFQPPVLLYQEDSYSITPNLASMFMVALPKI